MTNWGGTSLDRGTLFKVNVATGVLTSILDFTGVGGSSPGENPYGKLVSDGEGFFGGTTFIGGTNNIGTIFRADPLNGSAYPLVSLTGTGSQTNNGKQPYGSLTLHPNGDLYGTTPSGGPGGGGTIFRVHLHSDTDADGDGLPDTWEMANWGTIAGHGASDDEDGDGTVNLLEYAFGRNPLASDGGLFSPVIDAGYLTITLAKRAGVTLTVETAANPLGTSFSTSNTTVLIGTDTILKVRDNFPIATNWERFLRVRASAP